MERTHLFPSVPDIRRYALERPEVVDALTYIDQVSTSINRYLHEPNFAPTTERMSEDIYAALRRHDPIYESMLRCPRCGELYEFEVTSSISTRDSVEIRVSGHRCIAPIRSISISTAIRGLSSEPSIDGRRLLEVSYRTLSGQTESFICKLSEYQAALDDIAGAEVISNIELSDRDLTYEQFLALEDF